jgi:hypothetical protein
VAVSGLLLRSIDVSPEEVILISVPLSAYACYTIRVDRGHCLSRNALA